MARLCMVRHGETAWNAEGRVQGQLDIPLSAAGLAQAQCVAAALPGGRFSALYASDLERVRQTAQPAAEKLGLEVRVEDQGRGFDPCAVPDPLAAQNLSRPCGRGILFMRSFMDEVAFRRAAGGGTQVRMVKRRAPNARAARAREVTNPALP